MRPDNSTCEVAVATTTPGRVEAAVWTVSGDSWTMRELRDLVRGPPTATLVVVVVPMTPREVLALPASAFGPDALPKSTSSAWWGRSTRGALEATVKAVGEPADADPNAALEPEEASEGATSPVPVPPGVPEAPPLSLRRHPTFLGPDPFRRDARDAELMAEQLAEEAGREHVPARLPVLIAVAAGRRGALVTNETLSRMHADLSRPGGRGVDIVVLSYDDVDWDGVAGGCPGCSAEGTWAADATVVRRRGAMKWWLVKRFLHPDVASSGAYSWVLVLDEDAALGEGFDAEAFFATLERHGAVMGQPAHAAGSNTSFPFLQAPNARVLARTEGVEWQGRNTVDGAAGGAAGRTEVLWATMAECGPATAFDAGRAWPCVWGVLEPDLTSGYGYDLVWGDACGRGDEADVEAGGPAVRAAVTLDQQLRHVDLGSASQQHTGFHRRAVAEGLALFERRRRAARGGGDEAEDMHEAAARLALRAALSIPPGSGTFPVEPQVLGVGRLGGIAEAQ